MEDLYEQSFGDTQIAKPEFPKLRVIAGFWRRLAAFLIDSTILGLVGMLLGIFFYDFLARLGPLARVLGFLIAAAYFSMLEGSIGKGQTFGKRLLKIRVVNRDGQPIAVWQSFVRCIIFLIPYFLNGWYLKTSFDSVAVHVFTFLIFGIGGSIIYLGIFNRRTRQNFHDLIMRSYVVRSIPLGRVQPVAVWSFHYFVVAAICLLSMGAAILPSFLKNQVMADLFDLQKAIHSQAQVHFATVYVGKVWSSGGGQHNESTYFKSQVFWKTKPDDYEEAAKTVASIVLQNYPEVAEKDGMTIAVVYGYDIGISSAWKKQVFSYSPSAWAELLKQKKEPLEIFNFSEH